MVIFPRLVYVVLPPWNGSIVGSAIVTVESCARDITLGRISECIAMMVNRVTVDVIGCHEVFEREAHAAK
jgi:hypothetical protein